VLTDARSGIAEKRSEQLNFRHKIHVADGAHDVIRRRRHCLQIGQADTSREAYGENAHALRAILRRNLRCHDRIGQSVVGHDDDNLLGAGASSAVPGSENHRVDRLRKLDNEVCSS